MEQVYDELRDLAELYLNRERIGHTLQPTALVHEAYIRLFDATAVAGMDRTHFLAAAAGVMRHVLVDHARGRAASKRGGPGVEGRRVMLDSQVAVSVGLNIDVINLHEALDRLAALDARQSRVVDLRFFGGLTVAEVAELLGVSKRSVEDDWRMARAWLAHELKEELAA
jgi:RNA polymerase sigma factor (TIGR02999 family)